MTSGGPFQAQPGDDSVRRHAPVHCPQCGYGVDAVSMASAAPMPRDPVSGDFSLCWACTGLNVYVVGALGVALRPATLAEFDEFMADAGSAAAVRALQEHRRRLGPPPSVAGGSAP